MVGPQLPWIKRKTLPPSSTIPPNQQHPAKQLVIRTTPDGIVVHPHEEETACYRGPAAFCAWGRNGKVEALEDWVQEADGEESLVIDGAVAGLLRGFHDSYLLLVTGTRRVATVFDASKPISRIDTTLAIPLDHLAARTLLAKHAAQQGQAAGHRSTHSVSTEGGDSEDDETETDAELTVDSKGVVEDQEADSFPLQAEGAKDPLATTRGSLKRPFWRRSPFAPQAATPTPPAPAPPPATSAAAIGAFIIPEATFSSTASVDGDLAAIASRKDLDEKVVKECMRQLNGMYFSHAFDITHSLQHKCEAAQSSAATSSPSPSSSKDPPPPASPRGGLVEPASYLPLWRRADKRFWWNAHLMEPFVEAGLHSYVTVLQQGFIQQTNLSLPLQSYTSLAAPSSTDPAAPTSVSLSLLIISRRSVERPGLRYQRRGINVRGGVANFVESEFISCVERDGKNYVSSFVQTRGSIPVFWSQSPWSLKPPPVLERTPAESLAALTRHFEKQIKLYGSQIVVNLAETSGKEAVVVKAYRDGVEALGEDKVKYVEFDFHAECRGMRYENIGKLTDSLTHDLEELRCFWATDDQVFSTQAGVVRTNCIDCLDRTNVVQSAISRWVVNRHLVHLGITTQEELGMHDELDQRFNEIWADNGDAISREYAGTSALKGDFTRTGKRNWRGAVNDASNSVARLLQSTVTDFFAQAVIDYVLGRNLGAFAEFQERLDVSDPGEILRLYQIRQEAIETSTASVLSEGEEKLSGWTLLSPTEPDVVRSRKYEEKILLLSTKALYVVSYEFTLQKVVSFTRIPTGDIASIQKGAYILSALGTGRDAAENYGFIVRYHAGAVLSRVNTYSMRVTALSSPSRGASTASSASSTNSASDLHYFAFKALRRDTIQLASAGHSQILSRRQEDSNGTAMDTVAEIVSRLREEAEKVGAVEEGEKEWVVEKDIVSVAEAQAQTGLIDKLQYGLKALIWS